MDYKKYILDFVEGRETPQNFIRQVNGNPEICAYLQTLVPEDKIWQQIYRNDNGKYLTRSVPYDVKLVIEEYMTPDSVSIWGNYLNVHYAISQLICEAFPDEKIEVSDAIDNKFKFILEAVPEYLGGEEVNDIIDNIIDALPEDISKTKKIKLCKERLRECFHISGNKFPRWIQEANWPAGKNGIPMRFVEQKRKKGEWYDTMLYTEFLFEDIETGEIRTIAQFT